MLNAGVPPKVVAERLGHDPVVLLRIYASVMDGDEEQSNARIDAWREEQRSLLEGALRLERTG